MSNIRGITKFIIGYNVLSSYSNMTYINKLQALLGIFQNLLYGSNNFQHAEFIQ